MITSDASYQQLEDAVMSTGLWDHGRRHGPHRFVLSPQCYSLTVEQRHQLDHLAIALQRCLIGMSRLVAIGGDAGLHRSNDTYTWLYRLVNRGAPYAVLSTVRPSNVPLLCKVDLMVGTDGRFWIAEADATNPRSWGYSVVGRRLCDQIAPTATQLPGVIDYLARDLDRQGADPEVTFLYGDTQRFYAPEFQIVADELKERGIRMSVLNETNYRPGTILSGPDGRTPWLIDLPPMNRNKALIEGLKTTYQSRQMEFVIPPKHFLSSKAVLAVIANTDRDDEVEALLRGQIAAADLELVRRHVPPTYVVRQAQAAANRRHLANGPHVLKRGFASGMKGVWFSGGEGFEAAFEASSGKNGTYVLQQEVDQQPHDWAVYNAHGELTESPGWYVRLTGYFSRDGIRDLAVTARQSKAVHGNPDAIITGTVVV